MLHVRPHGNAHLHLQPPTKQVGLMVCLPGTETGWPASAVLITKLCAHLAAQCMSLPFLVHNHSSTKQAVVPWGPKTKPLETHVYRSLCRFDCRTALLFHDGNDSFVLQYIPVLHRKCCQAGQAEPSVAATPARLARWPASLHSNQLMQAMKGDTNNEQCDSSTISRN